MKKPDEEARKLLSEGLRISPIISQVLINRGIRDLEVAHRFLSPELSNLHSPLIMKDMEKASDRIIRAIFNNEKIIVYGDYDVDGTTAAAVLTNFLQGISADASFYIPDRLSEGYGLNSEAVKKIGNLGGKLIVTVDCGISDIEEIRLAQESGIDVIVTDHHEVPDGLPPAYAILNPKQKTCGFPFKSLAGVGVAFYLVIAVRTKLRETGFWKQKTVPNLKEYLDLVALGTIADMAPLIEENRIFVKFGLQQLTHGKRPGIVALKEVSGLKDTAITPGMVGFRLAPRINAAGRLSNAHDCVTLLITEDKKEADRIAKALDSENTNRQLIEDKIVKEAKEIVKRNEEIFTDKKIVLASPHWHPGVIGIAASRLVEEFYKPTVMISLDNGKGKGSARSIEGFHLYEGLKACTHLLEGFGGHKYAAGLTIKEENVHEFRRIFGDIVKERLSEEDFVPKIYIDGQMTLEEITGKFINDLQTLSPFGPKNPEPIFSSSILSVLSSNVVGNGHLKLKVREDGFLCDAIGFNMGERLPSPRESIKAAFFPQINEWQGTKTIQMRLKDIQVVS